ncbi:GDSL esterase/lipase [Melia azedarach]|uniref:GDSL esterase/lipase n=1 Tax=Melia azedarach TaxID=155640 RepID=A0ACC1XVG4_MELAZ|nr:GDSL esterase/lipase [Melia azedarach]
MSYHGFLVSLFFDHDSSPSSHLIIDQLASSFHLPSLKPYSHSQQQHSQLSYSTTLATKNAMVLCKCFLQGNDIQVSSADSTTSQLVSFGSYLSLVCHSDRLQRRQILRRALFVVDLRNNDYEYALLRGKSIGHVEERYTLLIVNNIVDMLSEIEKAGVSNILVPEVLPLGCVPGYISHLNDANPAALT